MKHAPTAAQTHGGPAETMTPADAPMGTRAPAAGGGHWYKTGRGWKWNGPGGNGSTSPRPGAEWNGRLLLPPGTLTPPHPVQMSGPPIRAQDLAPAQQMPEATAKQIINACGWDRSYSVSNLDALELVRAIERYYGRTQPAPAPKGVT